MKQQVAVNEPFVHGAHAHGVLFVEAEIHEPTVHVDGIESMLQIVTESLHNGTSGRERPLYDFFEARIVP